MNKRIQKKLAKQEAELQDAIHERAEASLKGLGDAYHDVEQSVQNLARSFVHEAQERANEAIGDLKSRLSNAEESVERTLQKIPRIGPTVAEKLHSATSSLRDGATPAAPSQAAAGKDGLHSVPEERHASYGDSNGASPRRAGPGEASVEYLDTIGSRPA